MPETVLVNGNAYSLLKLLGKGKGGYSYLAQMADGQQVVVKQIHHEPCAYYQFGNKIEAELRDYNHLQEIGIPMPRMLDVDTKAERIVKEYIAGETVYTLVLKDALPETCLRQVQAMCRLLYPAHTNIDYFPTNFILQGDTLYYIDYECNDYMDEWNFENWGCKYWAKRRNFCSMPPNTRNVCPLPRGLEKGIICSGSADFCFLQQKESKERIN